MKKIALFVFNGDPMCFIHVLLNALEMQSKRYECKIIVEGAATKLVAELVQEDNPMHKLWEKVKAGGLVDGVCKACSNKMGTLKSVEDQGLTLLDEMTGHPSMTRYHDAGFEIITF